jgi:hypothetical protein
VRQLNTEQREALVDKINGRLILASTSGGKDSGGMSLLLKELEIEHERMFMDTGWEKLALYHYVLRREQMNREAMKELYGPRAENGDLVRPLTDARGGKQFMLLDNGPNEGCMRWGLCDTGRSNRSDE